MSMQFNWKHRFMILLICMVIIFVLMVYLSAQNIEPTLATVEVCAEFETEEPIEIPTELSPMFIITLEERETLARLVFLEARGESYECQKAVVSVVINRWMSGQWGNTINSVIYSPKQFSDAWKIKTTTPYQMNYDAVDDVLQNGTTLPYYVMYFRANHYHKWTGYINYTTIDNTYFSYAIKDVK